MMTNLNLQFTCVLVAYSPHRGHAVRELTSGRFSTAQLSPEGTRVSPF